MKHYLKNIPLNEAPPKNFKEIILRGRYSTCPIRRRWQRIACDFKSCP